MNDSELKNGDWQNWRRYVIETLEAIRTEQRETQKAFTKLSVELAVLKVKSGLWGSIAGVVTAMVVILADYFIRK